MTLNPQLRQLLNDQINNEMASSYIYLAMAAYFEQTPYSGFASWMFAQSREETMHALKFYQYVVDDLDRLLRARLPGVEPRWFTGGSADRPVDLGYWMGYKISEAHYKNATDKKQAIRDLLLVKDCQQLLHASRYAEKFSGAAPTPK